MQNQMKKLLGAMLTGCGTDAGEQQGPNQPKIPPKRDF